MKKLKSWMMIAALGLSLMLSGCSEKAAEGPRIGVIQLMEHTSLNMIYDSLKEELETLGYQDGENCTIVFKNAQGEQSNIGSIVSSFQSEKLDVVVAIATPTAQSAAKLAETTPVIFSAVTDPITSGLTSSLEHPDQNITGTSDEVAVAQILDLALQLQPELKTLGMIYNVGEVNSQTNIAKAKEAAEKLGLTVIEAPVANTSEVAQAAQVLSEKCDALFSPNDNTVATAMSTGTATIGINYVELGKETARMVDQVLKGTDVSAIPVKVFNENLSVYVNTDALEELHLTLPESLAADAQLVTLKDPQ